MEVMQQQPVQPAAAAAAPATTAAPNATPYASASLYVGDLQQDVSESMLFDLFNNIGPVASVRVCRDAATRRSLGYAYVNFHRVDDAESALDTMNFSPIRGRACRIMWSQRDPTLRKSGAGNIFVKNLAKSIDNKTLYDTFSIFGNILSCKVATNGKGESLGYGFVHFESDEGAKNAITKVNGMVIAEQQVIVAPFKSRSERGANDKTKFTNLYVKNLPETFTLEKLDELFGKHGKITSRSLATVDDKSRGFGFVNFETAEQAQAAVEALNGQEIDDSKKQLYVGRAQKREERERELRERFEQVKQERQKKYAGVNLYVKNLSDEVDDNRLSELFAPFGSITSARVMKHPGTDRSRGFGFVCFSTPDEATKAVTEMNNKMENGKPLYVALAQRKDVRRAQLEAQHAQRAKMGMPQAGMYPTPGMYYPAPMPQRMMYPPQMANVRPGFNRRVPPQMGMPMSYMNMAVNAPAQPQQRGRGRGQKPKTSPQQGAQQGRGRAPPNYNYAQQGHNPTGMPMPAGPVPAAGLPLIQELAAAPEEQQKQMIGERLFPLIQEREPRRAGKITGMLLEMDNVELLHLLDSPEALREKIGEALAVLQAHEPEGADAAQ